MDVFVLHTEVVYAEWDVAGIYSTLDRAQAAHAAIYGEVEWKQSGERWTAEVEETSFFSTKTRTRLAEIECVTVDA